MTGRRIIVKVSAAVLVIAFLGCCSSKIDRESILGIAAEDPSGADTIDEATRVQEDLFIASYRSLLRKSKKRNKSQRNAPFSFTYYSFNAIGQTAEQWATAYPNFLRVTTSQDEFNLEAAGGKVNHILYIQDYVAHPLGSASSNRLPEIFWSGALHGDERVGPTSVMETAHLLLQAADCESKLSGFQKCRQQLLDVYGVDDTQRQWLARLVSTRRIVVVPTPNALGYAQNVREELFHDPNRDFPFNLLNDSCMKTVAARTLNEIFRRHMFQMALTLHGGMEVIR